jgi:hypothetical protein
VTWGTAIDDVQALVELGMEAINSTLSEVGFLYGKDPNLLIP